MDIITCHIRRFALGQEYIYSILILIIHNKWRFRMDKTTDVVKGRIENLKRIATRTPNSMITFTVARTPCKAFGKGAETVVRWIECDPNSAGEFEGHFEKRSE